jgi:hypothetical protein
LPPLPDVNLATHMKCYISPMSWVPDCPREGGNWRSSSAGGQHMRSVWLKFWWCGWRSLQRMAGRLFLWPDNLLSLHFRGHLFLLQLWWQVLQADHLEYLGTDEGKY